MGSIISHLIHSIEALERGSFEEALYSADEAIQVNKNSFWGWYLGAISLAFLQDESSFIFYFEKAKKILPGSIYFKYLKVYMDILRDSEVDAIIELTELAYEKNGWFAHELLEKIRSGNSLRKHALQGNIGKFVLIPNLKKELMLMKKNREKKKLNSNQSLLKVYFIFFSVICCFTGIFFGLRHLFFLKKENAQQELKNIHIPSKVSILRNLSARNFLYTYTNPKDIINDFEIAKQRIKEKKINQGRYFLQRILHSNADFATKEKSRIFTGFIPQVFFEEFDDPITPNQILKESKFYENSQVLWQGIIKSNNINETGKQFEIIIDEETHKVVIDAFLKEKIPNVKIKPYREYAKKNKLSSQEKSIVIFGKFKGLIGKEKRIYIELDRVWL